MTEGARPLSRSAADELLADRVAVPLPDLEVERIQGERVAGSLRQLLGPDRSHRPDGIAGSRDSASTATAIR
jgi:hypothetical protein